MTDDKDTAAKIKLLISKGNAQNHPETIQRGQVLGVSAFREQIGNSAAKRRWPLAPYAEIPQERMALQEADVA